MFREDTEKVKEPTFLSKALSSQELIISFFIFIFFKVLPRSIYLGKFIHEQHIFTWLVLSLHFNSLQSWSGKLCDKVLFMQALGYQELRHEDSKWWNHGVSSRWNIPKKIYSLTEVTRGGWDTYRFVIIISWVTDYLIIIKCLFWSIRTIYGLKFILTCIWTVYSYTNLLLFP